MTPRSAVALVALALLAGRAGAQERPSEEELFGAPAKEPVPPPAPTSPTPERPGAPEPPARREPPAAQAARPPPEGVISREREDALKVGGQLYLRAQTTFREDVSPGDASLSSPNLLDVYLDARPNDRVRGFVLGRLSHDPTLLPEESVSAAGGTLSLDAAFRGRALANPRGALDQLWLNFDLGRRVFVTAGKQHAKWGVGRFWNPTDYLHPVRRDPLAVYDVRTGTTLVKLHVPWEARGWNAYGVAVLEDVAGELPRRPDGTSDGTNRLGRVGVGGRVEAVLGTVEVGADALAQDGHRPRFGVDISAGVWDVDLYAEAALRTSVDTPRWRAIPGADPSAPILSRYERHDPLGFTPQVTVGGSWATKYSDEDAVTFGAEYFYDRSGYESPRIYPILLGVAAFEPVNLGTIANPIAGQPNPFTPFYLGRHYAGAFVSLPQPGRWNDTTFTLSVLGNLSDKSFVARLDHSVLALTYLRVETFAAGHFGAREGEFRLGFDVAPQVVAPGLPPSGFSSTPSVFEAGVALRVSL